MWARVLGVVVAMVVCMWLLDGERYSDKINNLKKPKKKKALFELQVVNS